MKEVPGSLICLMLWEHRKDRPIHRCSHNNRLPLKVGDEVINEVGEVSAYPLSFERCCCLFWALVMFF